MVHNREVTFSQKHYLYLRSFDISLSEFFSLNRIEYATARENLLLDYWEDLSEENQDVVLNVAKHLPKKEIAP